MPVILISSQGPNRSDLVVNPYRPDWFSSRGRRSTFSKTVRARKATDTQFYSGHNKSDLIAVAAPLGVFTFRFFRVVWRLGMFALLAYAAAGLVRQFRRYV